MAEIYFDESGNTGANSLDPVQPVYCLSGLAVSREEGDELLDRYFRDFTARDLKYKMLAHSTKGQRAIISFLEHLKRHPKIHKNFLALKPLNIIAKYVDWVVEPAAHDAGIELYQNGAAHDFAQAIWFAAPHAFPKEEWSRFLRAFQDWATDNGSDHRDLWQAVLRLNAPPEFEPLENLIKSPFSGGRLPIRPGDVRYAMDISFTSAYSLLSFWTEEGLREMDVVHDRSKVMEAQVDLWKELADPDLNKRFFSEVPGNWPELEVRSFRFGDQNSDPPLQLADVLAGANRECAEYLLKQKPGFGQVLYVSLGFPMITWSIWPGTKAGPSP